MKTEKKIKLTLRCPEKLHDAIQDSAQKKNMNLNNYICTTLAQSQNYRFYGNDSERLIRYVQNLRSDMTADCRLIQDQIKTLKENTTMKDSADNSVKKMGLIMLETMSQDFQKRSEIRDHCLAEIVRFIQGE